MVPGAVALAVGIVLSSISSDAQERAPAPSAGARVIGQFDAMGRVNPPGEALSGGVAYRSVLAYDDARHHERAAWEIGAGVIVTPAFVEPGVHAELVPLPFLALRAEGNAFAFLGANLGLARFPAANSAFGDAQLATAPVRATTGERAAGTLTLRTEIGRFVPRNETTVAYYHFEDAGPYIYENENDTLLAPSDGLLVNRTQLLVEAWRGGKDATLLVGPSYEQVRTFSTALDRGRAGAVASWVPADAWGALRRPRVLVLAGFDVVDPNRRGQPYALLGIGADVE
jgi:hypothetical protein